MADTGNGASITFSGGFSADIEMIDPPEEATPILDDSHLGTTGYETKFPGDLKSIAEWTFEFLFAEATQPASGTVETITITFPAGTTLSGTGFITKWKPGSLKNNEKMMATGSVQFDGKTGPTWT